MHWTKLSLKSLIGIAIVLILINLNNNSIGAVTFPSIFFDNFPEDITVACPNDIPEISTDITATSDCQGGSEVNFVSETYLGLEDKPGFCPTQVIRLYRATDNCGGLIESIHTITVDSECACSRCQDKVPHYLADLRDEPNTVWETGWVYGDGLCCDAQGNEDCISITVYLHPEATMLEIIDLREPSNMVAGLKMACGSDDVSGKYIPVEGGSIQTLTICKPGKEMQNIRITQKAGITAPEIACPADVSLEGCFNEDISSISKLPFSTSPISISEDELIEAGGSAMAQCGIDQITYQDVEGESMCPTIIERTFTLLDSCGQVSACTQTFTIIDFTSPTFTPPDDLTIYCDTDAADLYLTGDVTNEADNCSVGLEATYTDKSDSTNPCEQTITRLWSLTDNCGNYLTKHQIITIVPSAGISKIIDKPTLIIYPNPSSGTFNLIYSSEPGDVMISISDMTGRKVFEQGFSNSAGEIKEVVDILINGAGIYFLRLVDDSCVLFHRLVVE